MSRQIDVLIIDDNDVQLEYIQHLFESNEYSVHASNESARAIELIEEVNPRVVMLDVMMPDVDGLTILKMIRDRKELKKLPVIIYTSKSYPVDQKKAMRLGATAYLIKPIKGAEILEEIKKHLQD